MAVWWLHLPRFFQSGPRADLGGVRLPGKQSNASPFPSQVPKPGTEVAAGSKEAVGSGQRPAFGAARLAIKQSPSGRSRGGGAGCKRVDEVRGPPRVALWRAAVTGVHGRAQGTATRGRALGSRRWFEGGPRMQRRRWLMGAAVVDRCGMSFGGPLGAASPRGVGLYAQGWRGESGSADWRCFPANCTT